MKTRRLLTLLLTAIIGFLMVAQINVIKANTVNLTSNPITAPVTFFIISGKVTYFKLFGPSQPAPDVKVEATNISTNNKTSQSTDSSGRYTLAVEKGRYLVRVRDNKRTIFLPSLRFLNVDRSFFDIDFRGLLRR